jgi:hypothetical protein
MGITKLKALKAQAVALYKKSETNCRELGKKLIEIRHACGHGDYGKWLKQSDIDRNHANYCTRLIEKPREEKATARDRAVSKVAKGFRKLCAAAAEGKVDKAQAAANAIYAAVEKVLLAAKEAKKEAAKEAKPKAMAAHA